MSESKHTPGPWEVVRHNGASGEDAYIASENEPEIALVSAADFHGKLTEEDLANARLIAAAPDLLVACEELLGWAAGKDVRAAGGPVDAVFMAIDAVARARGEDG